MSLTMSSVVELCADLCLLAEPGPQGVSFRWSHPSMFYPSSHILYRIECGSGIAGRGHAWGVVRLPNGPALPKVTTRAALRRQLLEIMAEGPKPKPHPGFEVYARWHRTAHASSVQWFVRRHRRPGARRIPGVRRLP